MPRLYRKNGVYYIDLRIGGKRQRISTRCSDKRAAEVVAAQIQRDEADPDHAATSKATLTDALQLLIADREAQAKAGKKSEGTASFYRKKSGHWTRLLETNAGGTFAPFPLATLRAKHVDDYITTRRGEGVGESTISKELVCLRAALKLAKRAGIWNGDVDKILPSGFAPEYVPRKRALTQHEAKRLLAELAPDRSARVAYILATSANWRESERARREDIPKDLSKALVRGTKRATRHREVPIVSTIQREMLELAVAQAQGPGDPMFTRWINVRRDLHAACARAGIEPCTPNDLRRTCATWLRAQGVQPHLIAPVMGHTDSRMVERIYGRLPVGDLATRLTAELGVHAKSVVPNECPADAESADAAYLANDGRNQKTPLSRGFFGAQRRNRTADTRIFNPSIIPRNVAEGGVIPQAPQAECPIGAPVARHALARELLAGLVDGVTTSAQVAELAADVLAAAPADVLAAQAYLLAIGGPHEAMRAVELLDLVASSAQPQRKAQ